MYVWWNEDDVVRKDQRDLTKAFRHVIAGVKTSRVRVEVRVCVCVVCFITCTRKTIAELWLMFHIDAQRYAYSVRSTSSNALISHTHTHRTCCLYSAISHSRRFIRSACMQIIIIVVQSNVRRCSLISRPTPSTVFARPSSDVSLCCALG